MFFVNKPLVGAARILPQYFQPVVKKDEKGLKEESGKPLLCIFVL